MEFSKPKTVKRKKVEVRYTGPIMPLGGIYGPTVAQILDIHTISALLIKGYRTVEILNNGEEVLLTMSNYDLDLNGDGGAEVDKIAKPNEEVQKLPNKDKKPEPEKQQPQQPALGQQKAPEPQKPEEEPKQEEKKDDASDGDIKVNSANQTEEKKEAEVALKVNQPQGNNNQQNNQKNWKNGQQNQQSTSKSKADKLVSK